MTAVEVVSPVWEIRCDADGCTRHLIPGGRWEQQSAGMARGAARKVGWQVRPARGPGARKGPDRCPEHAA